MTPEDREIFKEYIFQANQSGKQETSGLVTDLKYKILDAVREEIRMTVNGKIDGVKEHLKNQDTLLQEIKGEQKIVSSNLATSTMNYAVDKSKIWIAITCLLFFGGTIITLSIMAINSKIKDGINEALTNKYDITNE